MADKAFLVDTTKCMGCKACQTACKQWNNLPAEGNPPVEEHISFFGIELTYPDKLSAITFNHVIFSNITGADTNKTVWQMMHKKCYHCEIPDCKKVCPSEAIYKNDYWVVIDQEKCIGCGECEKACIYNVPHISRTDYSEYGTGKYILKNKAYKCHACIQNYRDIPACAGVCPSEAITFDYRIKIAEKAKKRIKAISKDLPNASIYGLEEFGGMHVITILKDKPEKFGLQRNPSPIKSNRIDKINETYRALSFLSFGSPSLKRAVFRAVKSFMA